MLKDGKIWIANTEDGKNVFLLPKMANRHGLVAGATGTGKTRTAIGCLLKKISDKKRLLTIIATPFGPYPSYVISS